MALNPALETALRAAAPLVCLLIKIELPDHTIRLIDGGAPVLFGGELYSSEDPIYGVPSFIEDTSDQIGDEAPAMRMGMLPPTNLAIAGLTSPVAQGSPVFFWFGAINPETGTLIGEPDLQFWGRLDVPEISHPEGERALIFDIVSAWEVLFDNNEGYRWNSAFWTYLFGSNARAFDAVTNVGRKLFWGYNGPSNGSGGSFGGGNGSIGGGNDFARYDQL